MPANLRLMANLDPNADVRKKFAEAIKNDGRELAAARLMVTSAFLSYLIDGKRDPGLRLALGIEEVYGIPAREWVAEPLSRKI